MEAFFADVLAGLEEGGLLDDVFELAHVAGPAVAAHGLKCSGGEVDFGDGVAFGEIGGEFLGQKADVAAALAQRRDVDLHGREAVEEVFAEASFGDGAQEVDVRCGDDADVGAFHRRRAHAEVFARFEHAQKARLRRQGQLGHFVEENRASVGFFEVAPARVDGTGEGAFFVAEKLGVDGAFGDGAAVDGYVFGVFARAVGVDYLREKLFARAAFARDEDREVDWGHAHGAFDGGKESRSVAHDAEAAACGVGLSVEGAVGKDDVCGHLGVRCLR